MLVVTEAALLSRRSMAQYRVLRSEGLTCGPGYRFGQRQVGPSSASRPATRVSPKSLISSMMSFPEPATRAIRDGWRILKVIVRDRFSNMHERHAAASGVSPLMPCTIAEAETAHQRGA